MRTLLPVLLTGILLLPACSSEPAPELTITTIDPAVAAHEADSIARAANIQLAAGLTHSVWASDRLLADPIALAIDNQGRAYITRTQRQKNSEFDIRGYRQWMLASISWQSPEDRRNFLRQEFAPERSAENSWLADLNGDGSHDWRDLAVEQEEVYRIEDTSGDGVADRSQLYIKDFNTEITDVAGAVLPFGEDVYVGVAPDLWRLSDTNGDGQADAKTSISHGYAVHIGFGGHGMSGLIAGPDGRVYWSIGDIGFNVTGPDGKVWAYPHQGGIFRSEPDGSGFEVFAAGLRNTHEFVFDAYGNIISVDNDGDHPGEHERLVHIVEGSDTGWRTHWQFGKYTDPDNNGYKVWMDEGLYKPRFEGQAAFITPPVAAYHSGPAGMVYQPGTALGEGWSDRFFVAEFTGSPARSRIFAFTLAPRGASFELKEDVEIARGILTTGLDFGPDGALYAADWLDGWGTKDAGLIWKIDVDDNPHPLREETHQVLRDGLTDADNDRLGVLLSHADMRVRQEAQFELVRRGNNGLDVLRTAAFSSGNPFSRIHGIWGIGQMARRDPAHATILTKLLTDTDPEIRAQTAKTLGDLRHAEAADRLVALLADDAPRARFYAAEALGRIAYKPATEPLIAMLEANNDEDVYLRHAGALALARIGDRTPLVALAGHPSKALRLAAVVALRRLGDPGVAAFLQDADPHVVTEAARAINDDGGIEAALPALAALLDTPGLSGEPLLRRVVSANLRLGTPEHAQRLARYAERSGGAEVIRVEALAALGTWGNPSVVNRVDGRHQGPSPRDAAPAREQLARIGGGLLQGRSTAIALATAQAAGRLGAVALLPDLARLQRAAQTPELRIAALQARQALGDAELVNAIEQALADRTEEVRMAALGLIPGAALPGPSVAEMLYAILDRAPIPEQQAALRALGQVQTEYARDVVLRLMSRLSSGEWRPELQLDLLEAAEVHGADTLHTLVEGYRAGLAGASPVVAYGDALLGGDPLEGRRVVYRHEAAQCMRCHAIDGQGGDIGPALNGVASRLEREALLESLVAPAARTAAGYGDEGTSAMPPMGLILSRRELRDVVAFLATLQ